MTIWEARSLAVKKLQLAQSESNDRVIFSTPSLDADCLLAYVLGKDRSFLLAHNQDFLDNDDEKHFFSLIEKRSEGIPIAHIVGKKEFFGFDFFVTADVLIPKADTELLVEKALEIIKTNHSEYTEAVTIADVCTGSGCVGLSIIKTIIQANDSAMINFPLECHLIDISKPALDIAKKNANHLLSNDEQSQVLFFQGDLLESSPKEAFYKIIVSNPPYVPKSIVDTLLLDGRNEPRIALDGDIGCSESHDGLHIIKRLIPQAFERLCSGGYFLIETGEYNALETGSLMKNTGFIDVVTYEDLAGQPRVTVGRKP